MIGDRTSEGTQIVERERENKKKKKKKAGRDIPAPTLPFLRPRSMRLGVLMRKTPMPTLGSMVVSGEVGFRLDWYITLLVPESW